MMHHRLSEGRRPSSAARRYAAGALAGALMSLSAVSSASAFDETVLDHIEHFLECKSLLLADPEEHAAQCLPNRVAVVLETLAPKGPPGPPPPEQEEEEPSCPAGESLGSDGQCYPEERECEGSLDGDTCYVEDCTPEQSEDPFYHCFNEPT